ncbi:MAG: ATP-binding cassette domain-containing protein, partial [Candidatus Altiarchaeota archaeon]
MIKISNVKKTYSNNGHSLTALDGLDISINQGEIISFIGPSGCGKTTLLKLIAGLLRPTQGEILIRGEQIRTSPMESMNIVFQNPVLLPWRTIEENIKLPLEIKKKTTDANIIKRMLSLVGLEYFRERYPFELSGGMQQRVSLARALIDRPEL